MFNFRKYQNTIKRNTVPKIIELIEGKNSAKYDMSRNS